MQVSIYACFSFLNKKKWKMNHEYQKKIINESRIIGVEKAGITNVESERTPLPSSIRRTKTAF